MLINKKYVPRHEKAFAVCHWLNAFAFFMLFLTALPLYADTFRFMYNIFGDKTLMYAHRVFGVIFIATPIIGFFIAREGYLTMIKEVFRFGKKDMEFMQKFPIELMGKDPHMPPQGFCNGGEKMNIALQLALALVIALIVVVVLVIVLIAVQVVVPLGVDDVEGQLDVVGLGAAHHALLLFGRQGIPRLHVVQVFLHDDVAAAGKVRVFFADDGGLEGFLPFGVFGAVHKAHHRARVKVAKAVHFVHGLHGAIERVTPRVFLLTPASVEIDGGEVAEARGRFFNQS